jgi:hypothetical protein
MSGFARAEDYIGDEKNITFWIENYPVEYTQVGCCHVRFGSKAEVASQTHALAW